MPGKQPVLYVVLAIVALSIGLLVYLLDRQPEHTYFLSHVLTPAHAPHAVFGVAGDHLPAFLHVYAFMLFTVALAGSANARLIRIGAAWMAIAALFEFGQLPSVSPLIAVSLPAGFARFPLLDNIAAYFLQGTFDPSDLLAIVMGVLGAGLTVILVRNRAAPPPIKGPARGAWRHLAAGVAMLAGMLGIIASGGGGEGGFNYGANDDSLIYVGGNASDALLVYDRANSVAGDAGASRTVAGVATTLDAPRGIAVDMARNRIYVANPAGNSILSFDNARTVSGDVAPGRSISNAGTPISPAGLFVDPISDRLYVTSGNSVLVYDNASGLSGANISPNRTLTGVTSTLNAPLGVFVDTTRNILYVANGDSRILVFDSASTVDGSATAPARTIVLSANATGIFVDAMADRLYVTSGNTIRIFDGASTADSSAAPDRTISGSASRLNQPRDLFVDTGTDRLYVANAADDTVLVFNNAGTVNGSTSPNRILNLPAFTDPWGIYVDVTPIVIGSSASRDGYVLDDGSVNTDPVDNEPKTGDVEDTFGAWRNVARQFYSFELTGIPAGASVRAAALRLYQANVEGSPYGAGTLGSVIVDHVNYGTSLASGDYNAAALTANIGSLSTDATPGYKTLNVTANAASDVLASRARSQYRLRFSEEFSIDLGHDYAQFTDAEDSCCAANRPPQLVITIRP